LEEVTESPSEKRLQISFHRTVRVELEKEIVADGGRKIEPTPNTRRRGQIVASEFPRFDSRQCPFAEAYAQRSGNH
jgi:hypothetical protein